MNDSAYADAGVSPAPCRYGGSKLAFRGPARALDGRHIAFVGGTATYGKSVPEPFPALVEALLGEPCINLGQANASAEVALHDPAIGWICQQARATVLEVTGAANLSNRLYTVHPRRNDRFVKASSALTAIYAEVDFSEVCFTRHLLLRLMAANPDRFVIVQEELRMAWMARMRRLLDRLGPRVLLLWTEPPEEEAGPLGHDPLFVTREMVEGLRPLALGVVAVPAVDPLGERRHAATAAALVPPLREVLGEPVRASA
jgi:hypothetical protein